jgi:hypothetical protein
MLAIYKEEKSFSHDCGGWEIQGQMLTAVWQRFSLCFKTAP